VQGQIGEDPPPVPVVGAPVDETLGHHAVHERGEHRRGQQREVGELGHDVPLAVGEYLQHAPFLERAVLGDQDRGHPPRQQPLGAAQLVG